MATKKQIIERLDSLTDENTHLKNEVLALHAEIDDIRESDAKRTEKFGDTLKRIEAMEPQLNEAVLKTKKTVQAFNRDLKKTKGEITHELVQKIPGEVKKQLVVPQVYMDDVLQDKTGKYTIQHYIDDRVRSVEAYVKAELGPFAKRSDIDIITKAFTKETEKFARRAKKIEDKYEAVKAHSEESRGIITAYFGKNRVTSNRRRIVAVDSHIDTDKKV